LISFDDSLLLIGYSLANIRALKPPTDSPTVAAVMKPAALLLLAPPRIYYDTSASTPYVSVSGELGIGR